MQFYICIFKIVYGSFKTITKNSKHSFDACLRVFKGFYRQEAALARTDQILYHHNAAVGLEMSFNLIFSPVAFWFGPHIAERYVQVVCNQGTHANSTGGNACNHIGLAV